METSSIEQWKWAIKNASYPSKIDEDVRWNLLPKAKALIADQEVSYDDLLCTHKTAKQEQQSTRAELGKPRKIIVIAYNPQKVHHIYLKLDNGNIL